MKNAFFVSKKFLVLLLLSILIPAGAAFALEAPVGPNLFEAYEAISSPIVESTAELSKPIGFGSAAVGGSLMSIQVETGDYASAVDVYAGISAPVYFGSDLVLITKSGGIQLLSQGIVPWKTGVTQVAGDLLPDLGASLLASSEYMIFLLTVPAGTPTTALGENFHWWCSGLSVFQIRDVQSAALVLFSGQAQAGVAMLYALDSGATVEEIAAAVLAGTLGVDGTITRSKAARSVQRSLTGYDCDTPGDEEACRQQFTNEVEAFIESGGSGESMIQIILSLADAGYSAEQIQDAIVNFSAGIVDLDFSNWFIKDCTNQPCEIIRPDRVPPGVFADVSGTWLDFPFWNVTSIIYNYAVNVRGYLPYEGATPDRLWVTGNVPGNLDPVYVWDPTEAVNYEMDFYDAYSMLEHTWIDTVLGDVYRYGAFLGVTINLETKYSSSGETFAYRNIWVGKIPLESIQEKDGNKILKYSLEGEDVCEALQGIYVKTPDGVYTDYYCDEDSWFRVQLK